MTVGETASVGSVGVKITVLVAAVLVETGGNDCVTTTVDAPVLWVAGSVTVETITLEETEDPDCVIVTTVGAPVGGNRVLTTVLVNVTTLTVDDGAVTTEVGTVLTTVLNVVTMLELPTLVTVTTLGVAVGVIVLTIVLVKVTILIVGVPEIVTITG
ncbi:hypothetical protein BJ742DRAFT_830440 [Cladochytrium replicatum]|nr:hypothetical protein BJ742DRAFT_830440 [Cladochytrium replicatum]